MFTAKRNLPSWLISTQQAAPPSFATGAPTAVRVPSSASVKLDTRPGKAAPPAAVWASDYVVLPAAKLYKPLWKYDLKTLAQDLSAHLVYGLATATTLRLLTNHAVNSH